MVCAEGKLTARLKELLGDNVQLVQDFVNFEGNAQTLRLVTKLQILADFYGLNLTYGTLSALCKYTAASHEARLGEDHAKEKPGYFASETNVVKEIRAATGTGDARNPITFLVEAADDIVFSVADIEDAVKKGILSWRNLEDLLKDSGKDLILETLARKDHILKANKDEVPAGLADDVHASAFRTAAINLMVPSAVEMFKSRYTDIMNGTYQGELVQDASAAPLVVLFKQIGRKHIYCTQQTLKLDLMGRRVISDLLALFWEGAEKVPTDDAPQAWDFPGRLGALLSENYLRVFRNSVQESTEFPTTYHRLQLVTDYICGMTDSFAKRLHAELTNA